MKKYINFLLLIIVFITTSCLTQKKCNKRFPPEVHKIDSLVYVHDTTIVYKDTLITIAPDTTYIEYLLVCDTITNKPKDFIKTVKSGKSKAVVQLKDGKLEVECFCEEEKILITKLKEQIKISESKITKEKEKEIIREKYVPTLYRYSLYFSLLIIILCVLYILYRIGYARFKLF